MSPQSRVGLAAVVGLLVGLGTLAGVVLWLWGSGGEQEAAPTVTESVAPIPPDTGAPQVETVVPAERTLTVGGIPYAIAADEESVWVARDGRRVVRVDPATDAIVARVGVGAELGGERPCGIALGAGAVWVATLDGSVARINPEVNRVTRLVPLAGAACVAAGAGGIWVTSPDRGVVSRVDPGTLEIVAEIPVGGYPQGVATGFGSAWIAGTSAPGDVQGYVSRVDRQTNQVLATIPLATQPEWIAAGSDWVWVSANDGTVLRIDPRSNTIDGSPIPVGTEGRTTLAVGGGSLWATVMQEDAVGEALVTRVDAQTGELLGEPVPVGGTPLGMAFGAGSLWVANGVAGTVSAYAPAAG